MKNLILGVLLIAALGLGALYFQQSRKAATAEAAAQAQAAALQTQKEAEAQQAARLKEKLAETRADAAAKAIEAAQARNDLAASLTNLAQAKAKAAAIAANGSGTPAADGADAKPANPLAAMFNNPDMKELIRSQQKAVLGTMTEKNYGRFFAAAHLTPEQSTSLKDLIMNKQLAASEMGMSMFSGNLDEAKRADLVAQVKTSTDAADAQIKSLLGDDNYTQFQTYEKSIPERMQVSALKDQLGTGPLALTDDQEQQLVQAMAQQRESFKFANDPTDQTKLNADPTALFDETKLATRMQEMDKLNEQYLNTAKNILSPDQYKTFSSYLETQQTMQKAGLQMAAKMFAPTKPATK